MLKNSACGIWLARYSALGSRFSVGRCQDASKIKRSGASRCAASQSVSTIQFLALFGKACSLGKVEDRRRLMGRDRIAHGRREGRKRILSSVWTGENRR